ncbi:hypothetical protein [Fibrobacter succinogenes]|uniref:hypothetical protein n=1 Tax=Fibrobacter succinogenes TaxID=833 RepID=UPI0013D54BB0|nr:hypothetical protein [Fibrobacter succinogenes]
MDEQIESKTATILRLRINNEFDTYFYNIKVKYFIQKTDSIVIDKYDLPGAQISLDSLNENVWTITIAIDSIPPGIYPYEAGFCLGIHKKNNWMPRDKNKDPSYIASTNFVINDKVELNIGGNHLPNAKPLALVSGTKMLINDGDSIPFAWNKVPNAERYRLTIYSSDSTQIYQKETYGYRDAVVLNAEDYLWKVEAKNSTTEYGGTGSLINSLHIGNFSAGSVLEQKIHGIASTTGHKDTPMLVVGWGEFVDLREWDHPHMERSFLDENETSSCWAIAIKNLNQHFGGNLSLDEIRWHVQKETRGVTNTFGFGSSARAKGTGDVITGLKYAFDSTLAYEVYTAKHPLNYDDVKRYLNNEQEIIIGISAVETNGHDMLIDAYYTTTEGNFVRCINFDNLGKSVIISMDCLSKMVDWHIVMDAPQTVKNMDSLLGVEKFDKYSSWIEWTDSDNDGITDFDEIYRFGTNPNLADSDTDGVNDKDEIYSYTIMEKSLYNLIGAHIGDLSQIRFIDGIDDEYMADVDDD